MTLRLPRKRSAANTLTLLCQADKAELLHDAILAPCTCTHASPCRRGLYRLGMQIAVDLSCLLLPMLVLLWGQNAGRALRVYVAPVVEAEEGSVHDVDWDAVPCKSPRLRHSGSQLVFPSAGRASASQEVLELSPSEAAMTFSALGSGECLGSSPPSSQSASARRMDGLAGGAAPPPLTVTR